MSAERDELLAVIVEMDGAEQAQAVAEAAYHAADHEFIPEFFLWLYIRMRRDGQEIPMSQAYFLRVKRNSRLRERVQRARFLHAAVRILPPRSASSQAPQDSAAEDELEHRVRGAIDRLPLQEREVALLRVVKGMKLRQVAAVIGVSTNAAWRIEKRAIMHLREGLGIDPNGRAQMA